MVSSPTLETKNLSVVFNRGEPNQVVAFEDITFALQPEEILAIVGPSGCGKSTLFNVIAGLQPPTTGEVVVDGTLVSDAKGHVGYMLQKDLLLPWRSVLDNVALGLEVKGAGREQRYAVARKLINAYGLGGFEDARPSTLSGGMRQRVAFMRTLALDPKVILLDEPFSALDFQTRVHLQAEVLKIIKQHRKSAILVTHDIGEAVTMADRVMILSRRPGRIKRIVDIDLAGDERDPVRLRDNAKYQSYFQMLWDDLDH